MALSHAELTEFRLLYTNIFGKTNTVEETPEVLKHPSYPRYKKLAKEFYSMCVAERKKRGMRY
jgi:hypothetical protein